METRAKLYGVRLSAQKGRLVADLIRGLFPAIPAGEAERVAVHAYEVGSGRVGRTKNLSAEQKVMFAVRAHVRHEHTDYRDLLREGIAKKDARVWVADQIDAVLARWTGGTGRGGEA